MPVESLYFALQFLIYGMNEQCEVNSLRLVQQK